MPDVSLTVFLPGGDSMHLGPFTPAGSDMGFKAQFTIPAGTPGGSATVSDDARSGSTWGAYTFRVSGGQR